MKRVVIKALAQHHAEQARVFDERSKMGCSHCTSFDLATHHCKQWAATVPPEGLATGCDEFDFDWVPF